MQECVVALCLERIAEKPGWQFTRRIHSPARKLRTNPQFLSSKSAYKIKSKVISSCQGIQKLDWDVLEAMEVVRKFEVSENWVSSWLQISKRAKKLSQKLKILKNSSFMKQWTHSWARFSFNKSFKRYFRVWKSARGLCA